MSGKKTFEEYTKKILSEDNEEIPEVVKEATKILSIYEKTHGTEATFKMVEHAVMDEIRNDDGSDPGYVKYLTKFLSDMKKEIGQQSN